MLAMLMFVAAQAEGETLVPSFFTGETLYAICSRPNRGQCSMYVAGVLDGLFYARAHGEGDPLCPSPMTNRDAAELVTRYLEDHPELRPLAGSRLVRLALADRLDCD